MLRALFFASALVFGAVALLTSQRPTSAEVIGVVPAETHHPALLGMASGAIRCTGVRLSPRLFLSAAHCLGREPLQVCELKTGHCAGASVQSEHPRFDVALYSMNRALPHDSSVLPLAPTPLSTGQELILHGLGQRADKAPLPLRVRGEEAGHVHVVPVGEIAPCFGDSGGPVVSVPSVENSGTHFVGVLVGGTPSCRGPDVVIPVLALMSWLEEATREQIISSRRPNT